MFNLEEELKKLPGKPGVYLMHDASDEIIYVGKAISLKNRVRQYFQKSRNVTPKIQRMIDRIAWFEYIVTDSELEALVLECNLIKEHSPRYNTMLKDGKSYPFLKATVQEAYPRLLFARQMNRDGSRYFGPFTSGKAIRDTIELVNELFHLRSCRRSLPKDIGKERPCLYHQIGQCPAPCQGGVPEEEYRKNFERALKFLQGDTKEIVRELTEKMTRASEAMQFEEAAQYRDLIHSIEQVTERQKITSEDNEDRDIVAMARGGDEAVVQVFFIRGGKLIGREHYYLTGVEEEENANVLSAFIKQMYSGTPYIPREIWTEEEVSDGEAILTWLSAKRGRKVYFRVPKRGEKERLLELAKRNAYMVLTKDAEKLKAERARTIGAMEEIEGLLGLQGLSRVESYDISNINGFDTVGSMVVFENGKAKKNDYRKFRIRSVSGPDDYGAMEEMLTRRFEHSRRENLSELDSFRHLPDIIFMDGGKGQVNIAEKVLLNLNITIPVCGMVKDDHHRTRGLYFRNQELPIDTHGQGFRLITRIQDETHRFAIEYHKLIRSKTQVHSILDDIPTIGATRRKALMRHFESLEQIKNATLEELKEVPEMNERSAKEVIKALRGGQEE
ncbi:MAG: excinuclease ABC subunit UvrC [Lachnospiraceae bacterium]|nr:excinuclease ABC subunit UvrC [Lachnospiraceae bacterium]